MPDSAAVRGVKMQSQPSMTKQTILASIVRELERQQSDPDSCTLYISERAATHPSDAVIDGNVNLDALAAAIERDMALKWTACAQRLPELGKRVLLWLPWNDGPDIMKLVKHDDGSVDFREQCWRYACDIRNARKGHWAPLPDRPLKPPEE
jgi:hypothetical protein